MKIYTQRMYSIVMRHLSGIQKGIQAAHSIVEYANKYGETYEYKRWAKRDKTMIVLETHTTDALEGAMRKLNRAGIHAVGFKEPDLNDALTAVSFLVDERVFNTQKYPDVPMDSGLAFLRDFVKKFNLASN